MKTNIIRTTASTAKIVEHIWATWKAAAAAGGEVATATAARLGPHMEALTAADAELKAARDAETTAKAVMLQVDKKVCRTTVLVREGMWNAMGRPRISVFMDQVFPGGSETYTAAPAHARPGLIQLLKQRILAAVAQPKWKESLAAWVAQVTEHETELVAAVQTHQATLQRVELAKKGCYTSARTALIVLEMLARDLQNQGLSAAQIHGIIPDARLLAKAPASKPPVPATPPANDTDGVPPVSPHGTTG